MTQHADHAPSRTLHGTGVAVLAAAAAVATSTSYVLQPELRTVASDLGTDIPLIGVVAGAAILGYLVGLYLLVPLADRVRSNRLIAGQLLGLSVSLAIGATAPAAALLGVALLASGVFASTGAQMSSLAGRYAAPRARARAQTVGIVTAGISAGIVLGRLIGGVIADAVGWRGMLLAVAVACAVLGIACFLLLPRERLHAEGSYNSLIRSVPRLLVAERPVTLAAVAGACWFFSFSLLWVGVALALAAPPLSLPASVIGLYALAGLLGVLVTPAAGRLADRTGIRPVIVGGLVLAILCLCLMALSLNAPLPLIIGLALFDAGLFSAQVANQSRVIGMGGDRPALYNGAYMTVYFIGGTTGSLIGGAVVSTLGWTGLCILCAIAVLAAATLILLNRPRTQPSAKFQEPGDVDEQRSRP